MVFACIRMYLACIRMYSRYSHVYRTGQILRAQKALVLSCIVHVQIGVKVFTGIVKYHRYRVSNTCLVGQGSHTSSKHAKYVKYTHDTRARKWRSIASQYRSKRGQYTTILGIGGKQTPFWGEIEPLSADRGAAGGGRGATRGWRCAGIPSAMDLSRNRGANSSGTRGRQTWTITAKLARALKLPEGYR